MTSNLRLHRIAAFTAASVLFAITSTVAALASSGSAGNADAAPAPAAAAVVVGSDGVPADLIRAKIARPALAPTATPTVAPAAKPAPKPAPVVARALAVATPVVVRHAATPKPKAAPPKPAPRPVVARAATARTITISRYVDAPGSQKAIDACNLVLWSHAPLWLAAHNYCGFQWLSSVPTGTTVRVTSGAAAGTFVVTGHVLLNRQGGVMPALKADLVLQTCVGSSTGLTLLRRV